MGLLSRIKNLWKTNQKKIAETVQANASASLSIDQQEALRIVLSETWDTECILIHGAAGTGKSTLIREIIKQKQGRVLVSALTGLAAENVGGSTIHRLIKVGINPIRFRNNSQIPLLDADRREVFRNAEILVIDEISMVRVDLMDALDWSLRRNLGKESVPFGGIKIVLVGDMLQLGPISSQNDETELASWPGNMFFHANVWQEAKIRALSLSTVHRQCEDSEFAEVLHALRTDATLESAVDWLSENLRKNVDDEGKVVLCPQKAPAESVNESKLRQLPGLPQRYEGFIRGRFNESERRTLQHLNLKVGARVMIVANDLNSPARYVNGSLGIVKRMLQDRVEVEKDGGGSVTLEAFTWKLYEPRVNSDTGLLEYEAIAAFTQIPLKLAWAITVHKAQGLTFDRVHLLPSQGFFASGHAYVALSRCRSIKGLSSDRKLGIGDFHWNEALKTFLKAIEADPVWNQQKSDC